MRETYKFHLVMHDRMKATSVFPKQMLKLADYKFT